jgi:hypothetical protein
MRRVRVANHCGDDHPANGVELGFGLAGARDEESTISGLPDRPH